MVARQQYCGLQMTCQTASLILNLTNQILDMTSNLLSCCSNSKFSAVHSEYLVAPRQLRIGKKVWQNIGYEARVQQVIAMLVGCKLPLYHWPSPACS